MGNKRLYSGLAAALGMFVLILDSQTALQGAAEGLDLCIRSVIPSLFPFFLLSGILVSSLIGMTFPLLRPVGRILGIPEGAESLLISGFLGGYPVGAKSIRDAWANGYISKEDAQRMLAFCCNAGPAFLFGMAAPLFSGRTTGWALWAIHILSAVMIGCILPGKSCDRVVFKQNNLPNITRQLMDTLKVTAQVCGWIVLFRILLNYLDRWFLWYFPVWGQVSIRGLLELANGCLSLSEISSEGIRFLLCEAMLSFGGCCVALQTISVTPGLSLKHYFMGKLGQPILSLFFSAIYLGAISPLWIFGFLPLFLWKKKRKNSSIPVLLRV